MKHFIFNSGKHVLVVLIILPLLSGCNQAKQQQPAPQQQSMQSQQSDKIPDQLKDLEKSIEKIINDLQGPSVGVKEEPQAQQGQQGQQGQQSQQQGGQQSGQQSGQQGGQQSGQQGAQQGGQQGQAAQKPQPQDQWQKTAPTINTMHYQWTNYMPSAVKKGANRALVDNFSKALNNLTNAIMSKNRTSSLLTASSLYSYIPDFYSLYKTSSSPEIKRIRHYIRNVMLNSMTANWAQADSDMNNLKSSWSLYKNAIGKENQDDSNKLDFSIYELEKVVKEKNQSLVDIKGKVGLSNVEALEKAMEKGQGQGGQQGGQSGGGQQGG